MKTVLIAIAAIVLVAMPGIVYWCISENYASVRVSSTVTFKDGDMSSANDSCEDASYEEEVVACYESTSVEPHSTLERVVRGLFYSLVLGFGPLWAAFSFVDFLARKKQQQ